MQLELAAEVPDLASFTLLLPSVSVGNVGQLAIDVVLATLRPTLVSQVVHPSLIPCCGSDPLDPSSTALTTAMQLYVHTGARLAVLQLRSGLLPGEGGAFLRDLLAWAEGRGLARLVMLASSHSHHRGDRQLQGGSPLRYLATTALLAAAPPPKSFAAFENEVALVPGGGEGVVVPGGGLAARFVRACEEKGVEGCVLLKFCAEGDNTQDAMQVAEYLEQYLPWRPAGQASYLAPPSWAHLFGPPAPREMFW